MYQQVYCLITIFLIQTDQIPNLQFLPPERLLLLFLHFQVGFWFLKSSLPHIDQITTQLTPPRQTQGKQKMCTIQLQRHLGEWLIKSRSQFTGQNKTNRHGRTSRPKTLQKNYRRGRVEAGGWALGPCGVVVVDKANRSCKTHPSSFSIGSSTLLKISLKANQTKQIKNKEEAAGRESFYVCSEL